MGLGLETGRDAAHLSIPEDMNPMCTISSCCEFRAGLYNSAQSQCPYKTEPGKQKKKCIKILISFFYIYIFFYLFLFLPFLDNFLKSHKILFWFSAFKPLNFWTCLATWRYPKDVNSINKRKISTSADGISVVTAWCRYTRYRCWFSTIVAKSDPLRFPSPRHFVEFGWNL